MSITDSCYSQNIILEKAISLQLAVVEKANYNVQLHLVGIRGISGLGHWNNKFVAFTDNRGYPIEVNYALIGSGKYYTVGNPSISNLMATLQINIIYPDADPLPTRDPTETIWKGSISLSGGSVNGILNRLDGENAIEPTVYNFKGCYRMKCQSVVYTLNVTDVGLVAR